MDPTYTRGLFRLGLNVLVSRRQPYLRCGLTLYFSGVEHFEQTARCRRLCMLAVLPKGRRTSA